MSTLKTKSKKFAKDLAKAKADILIDAPEIDVDAMRLSDITVRQIRLFIEIAKTGSVTMAAKHMYMSQAAASRNLASLEHSLGVLLFTRSKKRISLTEAGTALTKDFRHILNMLNNSASKALSVQNAKTLNLRIGDYNSTLHEKYLLPIVDKFNASIGNQAGKGRLTIERRDPVSLYDGLMDGYYDGVFYSVLGKEKLLREGLKFRQIIKLYPQIAFSSRHRFYGKDGLTVDDFRREPIVIMARHYNFYWEFIEGICAEYKLEPSRFVVVDNPHSMIFEVLTGSCIAIVDDAHAMFEIDRIRSIRLGDDPVMGYGFAYSPDNSNPLLPKFAKMLCGIKF